MISGADNGTIHHGAVGQGECVRSCLVAVFPFIAVHDHYCMQVFKKTRAKLCFSILSLRAGNMSTGEMQPKQNGLNLFISCGCEEITKVLPSKDATGL